MSRGITMSEIRAGLRRALRYDDEDLSSLNELGLSLKKVFKAVTDHRAETYQLLEQIVARYGTGRDGAKDIDHIG